jgi:hypothetical protein
MSSRLAVIVQLVRVPSVQPGHRSAPKSILSTARPFAHRQNAQRT